MEKLKCTYPLSDVAEFIRKRKRVITVSAIQHAHQLGFSETEIYDIILELDWTDFCKSMASYSDHKLWQDVYKIERKGINLYIKLQVRDDKAVIVSFKKDQPEA